MIILLLSPRVLTATRLISEKRDFVCQSCYSIIIALVDTPVSINLRKFISFTPIIIIIIIKVVVPVHNIRSNDHKMIDSSCVYLLQSNDAK